MTPPSSPSRKLVYKARSLPQVQISSSRMATSSGPCTPTLSTARASSKTTPLRSRRASALSHHRAHEESGSSGCDLGTGVLITAGSSYTSRAGLVWSLKLWRLMDYRRARQRTVWCEEPRMRRRRGCIPCTVVEWTQNQQCSAPAYTPCTIMSRHRQLEVDSARW